jgi:hypothetical protein
MAVAAVTRHSPSRCLREIGRYAVILRERQHPGLVEEAHGGAPHVRRQVGVPERHLDALVPEQLLDGLERRAAHHEVARERVAEPVRGDALREVHFDGTTSFTIEWLMRFPASSQKTYGPRRCRWRSCRSTAESALHDVNYASPPRCRRAELVEAP